MSDSSSTNDPAMSNKPTLHLAKAIITQLRPRQWTKNGLLYAGLIFSGQFTDPEAWVLSTIGFFAFCMLSSSGYILNDILDREADKKHPKKCLRPIASGNLSLPMGWVLFVTCFALGASLSIWCSWFFAAIAGAYFATTISYSTYWKYQVILDVMFLALGFVWRAIAGAVAIHVHVSPWLFLCTAFLALFLGFNKRRAELLRMGDSAGTRANLALYAPNMLVQFQSIVTANAIVCYALYTILADVTQWMVLTIPYVLYGIFRYIYLVDKMGEGEAPDETLLKDKPILLTVILWAATCTTILYCENAGLLPALLP